MATVVGAVFIVSACAGQPTEVASETHSFEDLIAQTVVDAEQGGAGDAQIEALKSAEISGSVDFEPMANAARETIDCLNESGFVAEYNVDELPGGIDFPNYVFRSIDQDLSPDEVEELALTCETRHFSYLSYVYQVQPTVVEAVDQEFETGREQLVACLESNGVNTSDLATRSELVEAAIRLLLPELTEGEQTLGVDCLAEAGIRTG